MLYALGLSEKVVGTAVWFNEVLPQFGEQNSRVERLADNHPSFESVVAKEPELVTTQFEGHVGAQGSVGTREQFNDLGVNVYAMPADCVGKDNLVGGDGTRKTAFQIETVYQAIRELSTIFDVQDRGAELEAELRGRVEAASAKAKALNLKDASAVVWFSSPDIDLDPFVAGQKGIPAFILSQLGIRNIIESDEEWPSVGWERIAQADPDIIIIARMDRRRFEADDYEVKLKFLKDDPVTSEMTAVKEGRLVVVDAHAIHASIRIADGIEVISEALAKAGLPNR
jgi:iron complex transport system substrate-binding protein